MQKASLFGILFFPLFALAQTPAIKVDQFGYKTMAEKIAVLSDPIVGFNASDAYTPSANLQVISAADGSIALTTSPIIWNAGNTHNASGDKAWWLDFSSVQTEGDYYIYDPGNAISSDTFTISDQVYKNVLEAAFKTFYYQRCGQAKSTPYCATGYADAACHVGALQDLNCRLITNPTAASEKDLSGGWHDAGDYNKYVNFLWATMVDMLMAYEYNPEAWNDDMDIPESGNYIPDLLDEVKIETDWLLKMQEPNGSVLSIVGVIGGKASPPSTDNLQRYYGPATTSASFTAATTLALAAYQFAKVNIADAQNYAATLEAAAIAAYDWSTNNALVTFQNSGVVGAGEQEVDQYGRAMRQLSAAIFLYAQTGTNTYKNYVESNYQNAHMLQWGFVYGFETAIQQSLMFYAHLPGVNSTVAQNIIDAFKNSMDGNANNIPAHTNNLDPYRSHMSDGDHGWGSNGVKLAMGNLYQIYEHYNLDINLNTQLNNIQSDYLHYLHGVNPIALAYLTNANSLGAERSAKTIYHAWFDDGSALWDEVGSSTYGPAIGFLPGGPNPFWSLDDCCPNNCGGLNSFCITLDPPSNQPILKSYLEWNGDWPQNSWEVTENAIYYQTVYLNLLSGQVDNSLELASINHSQIDNADIYLSTPGAGLVLTSESNAQFILSIDNDGKIQLNSFTSSQAGDVLLKYNYLRITEAGKGLILKSINGSNWRLGIDNLGKIQLNNLASIPSGKVNQQSGNLIIEEPSHGIIFKNGLNNCFLLKVNDAGALVSLSVSCP